MNCVLQILALFSLQNLFPCRMGSPAHGTKFVEKIVQTRDESEMFDFFELCRRISLVKKNCVVKVLLQGAGDTRFFHESHLQHEKFVAETKTFGRKSCNRMKFNMGTHLNIFMRLQQIVFFVAIAWNLFPCPLSLNLLEKFLFLIISKSLKFIINFV